MFCIHPTLAFCVIETIESGAEQRESGERCLGRRQQMMSLIRCLIKKIVYIVYNRENTKENNAKRNETNAKRIEMKNKERERAKGEREQK